MNIKLVLEGCIMHDIVPSVKELMCSFPKINYVTQVLSGRINETC